MQLNPKISVITVCYQSRATIGDTLVSIAKQTYRNFEHVVVDGGSTDGTLDLVSRWEGHPVHCVSGPDAGIYDAMNKGLALASGEIVGFLNADDFYADASVLEQIAAAFGDDATEACYADLVYVNPVSLGTVRYWRSEPFRSGMFAVGWCPPHPTFYVRKEVVERCGGFDLSFRLAADAEFMMRYLEGCHVRARHIPGVWVKMRLGGQTNQSWVNIVRQNREIIRALGMHGIPVSYVRFVAGKLLNRTIQFVRAKTGA